MEYINNANLFCQILKNQEIIMCALATKCKQYKDELLGAASEIDNIIVNVHRSEYMAEALKSIYQIDFPQDRYEQLVDFANLLFKDADTEHS